MSMNQTVGSNIRKYRLAYNYTLETLAGKIHKSRSTISKYEKGHISIDVDTIEELANIFQIPSAQLLAVPCEGSSLPEKLDFLNYRYMYAYDGKRKRVMKSVLEEFQTSDAETIAVQLFYDVEDLKNPGKCNVIYSGDVKKFDLCHNYNLQNQSNSMEQIWICSLNGLSQNNSQIGILAGLNSVTMSPCARKILISPSSRKETEILPELLLTKEDVQLFKKQNAFTVKESLI